MKPHWNILEMKWPTFNPYFAHISVQCQGIGLKTLSQPPHYSPKICSKFQPIWTFLDWDRFLRGGGALRPPPPQKSQFFTRKIKIEINAWKDSPKFALSETIWFLIWYLIFSQDFWWFPLKNMHFSHKMENVFRFFSEHGFDGVSPTLLSPSTIWNQYFFFVWKLVSRASLPRRPFFKMSLSLSYKCTSLRKKHHFLGFFRVIELFIRFLRLQGGI